MSQVRVLFEAPNKQPLQTGWLFVLCTAKAVHNSVKTVAVQSRVPAVNCRRKNNPVNFFRCDKNQAAAVADNLFKVTGSICSCLAVTLLSLRDISPVRGSTVCGTMQNVLKTLIYNQVFFSFGKRIIFNRNLVKKVLMSLENNGINT